MGMGSKKNERYRKKRQLKGVALKRCETKELKKIQESDQSPTLVDVPCSIESNDTNNANLVRPTDSLQENISASECKIGTLALSTGNSDSSNDSREGYMLLDLELLGAYLDIVCCFGHS